MKHAGLSDIKFVSLNWLSTCRQIGRVVHVSYQENGASPNRRAQVYTPLPIQRSHSHQKQYGVYLR
jgi:hypothetical protein